MAQVRGHPLLQDRRLHGLEQAGLLGAPQAAGVDCNQDVRRAVHVLAANPLDQLIALAFEAIDLNAGQLREAVVKRLVGLVMARGVEVELRLLGLTAQAEHEAAEQKRAGHPQ